MNYSLFKKGGDILQIIHKCSIVREFDTSFFIIVIQILCLSRFRLIFLSNFMILCVLFCAFCSIIDSIGGFLNVYQYHWQQR